MIALFSQEQRTNLCRKQTRLYILAFLLQYHFLSLVSTTFIARRRSLFQAYVEEVQDEDAFADEVLVTTPETMMTTSSYVLDLPLTDKHENAILELHEALNNLMAAAGVYPLPKKTEALSKSAEMRYAGADFSSKEKLLLSSRHRIFVRRTSYRSEFCARMGISTKVEDIAN
jgi:hypothetical protein